MSKSYYSKLKALLSFSFLLVALIGYSQITVSGTISDAKNSPIIGATVLLTGSNTGTVSDIDGKYSISVPNEGGTIRYSYIGSLSQTVNVPSGSSNMMLDINLSEDALALDEVVVTGTFSGRTQKEAPMSLTVLSAKQIQRLAGSSQADILRTVPGIVAEGGGGEVATNLFVRGFPSGGQYAFTPLQIDGIPILSTFGLNSSAMMCFLEMILVSEIWNL